jgi:ACS family hexuronate transporter-like MFS transporter
VALQLIAGSLTDTFAGNPQKAYLIMFSICAISYLSAWCIMKLLVPRQQPIAEL